MKTTQEPLPNSNAGDLLKWQYRWMRFGWPLVAAVLGLFVTLAALWVMHPSPGQIQKWERMPLWWMTGIALSLAIALLLLVVRRRSIVQSARHLDLSLDARNRMEAAALLTAATDPIARAQREETTEFLRGAAAKPRRWSLRLLGTALCLAVLAHLFTFATWKRPWQASVLPVSSPAPTPAAAIPKATIVWKTPAAETNAAPIEEVPLTAVADSTSGLRDMTLEISVNGEHRLSAKVPVDSLDKSGKHPIAVSVYLDQLNVEPFDMVSYHLQAQRISQSQLPATTSPVQFVEVKPFRDDVTRMPPMGGAAGKALASIMALKIAQLRLVKENFLLAHTDLTHDDQSWLTEDQRVGGEQGVLETKTGETVDQMTQAGMPAQIIDLLNQARPFMSDAAGKITAKNNEPALPPQGKSLALLTATEKYVRKVMSNSNSQAQSQPKPKDPFEKRKDLDLKPRSSTPAGELENLAKEQEQLAHDMAQNAQQQQQGEQGQQGQQQQQQGQQTPQAQQGNQQGQQGSQGQGQQNTASQQSNTQGTPAQRQAAINQKLDNLMKDGQQFDPAVTDHLENGRKLADESLKQLNAGDPAQAQEPAAATARELRQAAEAMDKAGQQQAAQQIADAVQMLDQAATAAQNAPQQKADTDARGEAQKAQDNVAQAKANLADAAQQQQEAGSEKAAARLAEFAKMLNDDSLRSDMQKLHDQPHDTAQAGTVAGKLNNIADQLAASPDSAPKTPDQIAQLIDRVERTKANLDRLAATEPGNQGQNPGAGSPPPSGQKGQNPGTGGPNSEQQRQTYAKQVLDDIRQETADAQALLPDQSTAELRAALPKRDSNRPGPSRYGAGGNVVASFPKISGPLASVISLLRAQLLHSRRENDIADESEAAAPAAYRDAVADYFEQLSRDYGKSPAPAPQDKQPPQ